MMVDAAMTASESFSGLRCWLRQCRAGLALGVAVLGGCLLSSPAAALGLGSIQVVSAPSEPLEARIRLFPSSPDWREGFQVGLASASVFERVGVERTAVLDQLRFSVGMVAEGAEPYIAVTTERPLAEDVLSFIVEVRWFGGRVFREYTLLLEPAPLFAVEPRVSPPPTPAAPDPGRGLIARPPPPDAEPPTAAEPPPAAAPSDEPVAEPATGSEVVVTLRRREDMREVVRNDTLWAIALETRPDAGVSLYQMMLAIYRANPDAFINNNLNLIRAGAVLRIPERQELLSVTDASARAAFATQVAEWELMRSPTVAAPAAEATGRRPRAADRNRDLLRVVAAGDAVGDAAGEDAEAALTSPRPLREEVISLQEREASLSAERDELERMNRELLARLEALERVVNVQADLGIRPDTAGQRSPQASSGSEADAVPFWLDRRTHAALALVIMFLLLLWVLRLRRERDEARLVAYGALADGELDEQEPRPARGAAPLGDQRARGAKRGSVPSVLTQATGVQFFSTFDPAGEAEHFVQRREYRHADDLLVLALAMDPGAVDVWLRRLQVCAVADDAAHFLEIAGAFRTRFGSEHPRWVQVQALGKRLLPSHAWFSSGAGGAAAVPSSASGEASDASGGGQVSWDSAFAHGAEHTAATTEAASPDDAMVIGQAVRSDSAAGKSAAAGSILTWSAGGVERGQGRQVRGRSLRERPSETLGGTLSSANGRVVASGNGGEAEERGPRRSRVERARVYLERGDREMARHLLQEVLKSGPEEDRAAARSLMERCV